MAGPIETAGDDTRTSLDGHGIFAIIVFAIVALICIQPLYIPVPHVIARRATASKARLLGQAFDPPPQRQRAYIVLNHVWTPAVGILFLLASKTIGGMQIKLGIVGEEGVEPYDVLIFFISLAYIAISLDATGLLRYLAFQVCLKAGTSGMRLYLVLYSFFWTLGVMVGNDPVILSGTAFLVYLTRVAGISPPSAWVWGQFVAANISSAVLVSSNPTNLVIASGFNISFPVYTAYMVMPSLASALAALGAILLFFRNEKPPGAVKAPTRAESIGKGWTKRTASLKTQVRQRSKTPTTTTFEMKEIAVPNHDTDDDIAADARRAPTIYIPKTIVRPDVDAKAALVDPKGAIFNSVVMAATLITVIVTNVTGGAKVYMVAAPGAAVCIVRDVVHDWYTWRAIRKSHAPTTGGDAMEMQGEQVAPTSNEPPAGNTLTEKPFVESPTDKPVEPSTAKPAPTPAPKYSLAPVTAALDHLQDVFPTVTYVCARLPFTLLPFAFGMFILVQSLGHVGFINIMAGGLGDVCAAGGYVGCSFFISMLGVVLCNLGGTNIGATILLTRALQSVYFQRKLPVDDAALILRAASYSVAFGSNVGALGGTFAASLAGLLWRDGLLQRGVVVTKAQFFVWCAVVIVPATAAGVAVLLPEVRYFSL